MSQKTLEELLEEVRELQDRGILPKWPTDAERVSWVYGNCVLSNPNVTREMVEEIVKNNPGRKS